MKKAVYQQLKLPYLESAPHKSLHVVGESNSANVMGPNWLQFP
jgi:hypothetical protein